MLNLLLCFYSAAFLGERHPVPFLAPVAHPALYHHSSDLATLTAPVPLQSGPESAVALLRVLSAAVDAMDAAALAAHHEAVFGALLRALDLRRRRPAALLAHRCGRFLSCLTSCQRQCMRCKVWRTGPVFIWHSLPLNPPIRVSPGRRSGGVDKCETAAVEAFVGLTMRLTEARFKPLFFRLLEWAHAVPAGDSGACSGVQSWCAPGWCRAWIGMQSWTLAPTWG